MINRNTSNENLVTAGALPATGLRDVCRIFFRHKRKMIVVFCTTLALVVVGLMVFPRTYTSDARLLVRLGKESVGLDPTATLSQTVSIDGQRENEINSEIEILRSRVLLEDVVDRIGYEEILDMSAEGGGSWTEPVVQALSTAKSWLTGTISPTERAVRKLAKSIGVNSPRKSNVIVVTCDSRNPELAQRILQSFLDSYLVRHVKANRTSGSHSFFVDQSDLLRDQLTLASEELRDAKNKDGLASIEGQRANVEAQANVIEIAMLENQRALSSSEAKVTALRALLNELPEKQLAEETEVPSYAADEMRRELYKVQIQEKEASSRYTALHPKVIALRRQVEETRQILASEEAHRNQPTKKLNVVHQNVQTELAQVKAMAAAQKAESEALKQQFEAVQSKIRALNDHELQITELERKTELLEDSYRTYAINREQARIDQALESGRISNVNMVQPATFVAKPSAPWVGLTLLGGLFLATLGAVLVAFAAEYLDPSLKTPEQTEHELGIPVLFSVPRGARNELLIK